MNQTNRAASTLGWNFTANGKHVTDIDQCHYCLRDINVLTRTKDHVVPRSMGGLDVRWNIVWSCRQCNSFKASNPVICRCSFCRRSVRRHWEELRIDATGRKTKH